MWGRNGESRGPTIPKGRRWGGGGSSTVYLRGVSYSIPEGVNRGREVVIPKGFSHRRGRTLEDTLP